MTAVLIATAASGIALGLVVRQGQVWLSPVPLVPLILARYGWATVLLVAAVAGALLLRLTLDLRWFESLGLTAGVR